MAGADYYSCDVCGGKTFYDATLYEYASDAGPYDKCVGAMVVLCLACAKTHNVVIQKKRRGEGDDDAS